jgi:hypothetical protein
MKVVQGRRRVEFTSFDFNEKAEKPLRKSDQ